MRSVDYHSFDKQPVSFKTHYLISGSAISEGSLFTLMLVATNVRALIGTFFSSRVEIIFLLHKPFLTGTSHKLLDEHVYHSSRYLISYFYTRYVLSYHRLIFFKLLESVIFHAIS